MYGPRHSAYRDDHDPSYAHGQRAGLSTLHALGVTTAPARARPSAAVPSVQARPKPSASAGLRRISITVIMILAVVMTFALARLLGDHLGRLLRAAIYAVWLVPMGELALLALGQAHYRLRFKRTRRGHFRLLIIQITTTGNEAVRVNEIIAQIRSYDLRMPYEIWVVTEPWGAVTARDGYPSATRVFVVPENFTARSERKARALEFSRHIRSRWGLDTADVKILFNDDDVTPTESYIKTAFVANYDVCEGITVPRVHYSTRPLAHFFASHVDDTRTRGCLTYCSVFQGMLGKPLWVHGEGLTATGTTVRVCDLITSQVGAARSRAW